MNSAIHMYIHSYRHAIHIRDIYDFSGTSLRLQGDLDIPPTWFQAKFWLYFKLGANSKFTEFYYQKCYVLCSQSRAMARNGAIWMIGEKDKMVCAR